MSHFVPVSLPVGLAPWAQVVVPLVAFLALGVVLLILLVGGSPQSREHRERTGWLLAGGFMLGLAGVLLPVVTSGF